MFKELVKTIESNEKFVQWKARTKTAFLTNLFFQDDQRQFSYYDPETNKMTTFFLVGEELSVLEDQEILETGKKVLPLDLVEVKITIENAVAKAKENMNEEIIKSFIVLQTLDDKPIFNITFFTQTQKIFNTKLNAIDGEIIGQTTTKLTDFYKVAK